MVVRTCHPVKHEGEAGRWRGGKLKVSLERRRTTGMRRIERRRMGMDSKRKKTMEKTGRWMRRRRRKNCWHSSKRECEKCGRLLIGTLLRGYIVS